MGDRCLGHRPEHARLVAVVGSRERADLSKDATVFTKNRKRLLEHEVADEFFAAVVTQAKLPLHLQ